MKKIEKKNSKSILIFFFDFFVLGVVVEIVKIIVKTI